MWMLIVALLVVLYVFRKVGIVIFGGIILGTMRVLGMMFSGILGFLLLAEVIKFVLV